MSMTYLFTLLLKFLSIFFASSSELTISPTAGSAELLGSPLGAWLGSSVGAWLGSSVGAWLGSSVGAWLGSSVGA